MRAFAVFSAVAVLGVNPVSAEETYPTGAQDRSDTVATLERIALPVLQAQAEERLQRDLPQTSWARGRAHYSPLEAFVRTLSGVAPWIELGPDDSPEGKRRAAMGDLAVRGLKNALNPASPGHLTFESDEIRQGLVEAGVFSLALLRAPGQLWGRLSDAERKLLVEDLKKSRKTIPYENNWLLFSAMVEAALWKFTGECERAPIEKAVNRHMEWYMGDGTYGDGSEFHWDYYNSFVIHPMLLEVLKICREKGDPLGELYPKAVDRARRYAEVQERMISPEGTFPVIGRSSQYRLASMQLLSGMILSGEAPKHLISGSTRAALSAVARRIFEMPGVFDEEGWLQRGVAGHQPRIHEGYTTPGSLYATTTGFLHLGLPAGHPFWTAPGGPWTQRRIWSGDPEAPADHALKNR